MSMQWPQRAFWSVIRPIALALVAGGFILPNDHVDVILTRRTRVAANTPGPEGHSSETILRNVRVLAIDQNVQEKDGQRVVVGKTATLELAPHQAEALTLAQQDGTLAASWHGAWRCAFRIFGAAVERTILLIS
jgi:Flp pilus assembly protein CpaB